MKRSTTRWTTALAAVALLGMPAAGSAQTGTTPQPQAATAAQAEAREPGEHLREARAALDDIDAAAVTGRAKTQLTQLKQHISALERAASARSAASAAASATGTQARSNNWSTELAAADRILTEMLGTASATGTAGATGTSGTAGATGTSGAASGTVEDEAARAKLMEVRKHMTKFAAAIGGTADRTDTSAASAAGSSSSPAAGSTAGSTPATGTSAAQPPAGTTPTAQQPEDPQQQSAAQVDTEAARRHLTEARETLSEMTQLPAAATLTGDTRTQVNALIANFNELITNQTDWRASYKKVEDNLAALLGPEDPMAAGTGATTGTTGAVGTSGAGAATLDAEIRSKLEALRTKLNEFERAVGGASPASQPSNTAATGSTSGAAGMTSGSTTGSTGAAAAHQAHDPAQQTGTVDRAEAMRHIDAIEAILSGNTAAGTAGTSGTTGTSATPAATAGAPLTLSRTQIEQLRTHLNALKRVVEEK
jgi:collagen type VII alpha